MKFFLKKLIQSFMDRELWARDWCYVAHSWSWQECESKLTEWEYWCPKCRAGR